MGRHLLTSESVTVGHPDKLCDIVSDMIVDDVLAHDRHAHVAAETCMCGNRSMVFGEISAANGYMPNVKAIVRRALKYAGYTNPEYGTSPEHALVESLLHAQSPEIGVAADDGAGDQGIMIGYATNESRTLLPLTLEFAHRLAHRLQSERESHHVPWLRPDGKTQVTLEYENDRPVGVDTILVSAQHDPNIPHDEIEQTIIDHVILPVLRDYPTLDIRRMRFVVNPSGSFILGGPAADAGLTGRKIVVDQYGGIAPVGGGCQSGKDPSKQDRSGLYAARWIAVNLVKAGLCDRALVRIAYMIGRAEPVGVDVDTEGTGVIPDDILADLVRETFDLTPHGIIDALDLTRMEYTRCAAYGQVGQSFQPWEWASKAGELLERLGVHADSAKE